jgi:hypothetical protein
MSESAESTLAIHWSRWQDENFPIEKKDTNQNTDEYDVEDPWEC